MNADATTIFKEEAAELLASMEHMLLELENDPSSTDNIATFFRCIHTIKGSGAMFGFDELARFAHEVETVFDLARAGEITLDAGLLGLALKAKDHIALLLTVQYPGEELVSASDELMARFEKYLGGGASGAVRAHEAPEAPPGQEVTLLVRYRPAPGTFLSGNDPQSLVEELEGLGRLWHSVRTDGVPPIEDMDPRSAYVWWDMLLVTDKGEDAARDVFIFVADEGGLDVGQVAPGPIRSSDIPVLMGMAEEGADKPFKQLCTGLAGWIAAQVNKRAPQETVQAVAAQAGQTSIRVDSARLDRMVNLVGELVIVQSRLSQAASGSADAALRSIAEDLQRLSSEMRDHTLGIRMIPIGSIYGTMRRLVHDLCETVGKSALFEGLGAQTELDKNVIDQLKDPLVHILRNSIDHGLETPEERALAGKPERGRVTLDAAHSGGNVVITISDDGKGIDPAKVRAKALEKGLIQPTDELAEKDVLSLIFSPGFSTAQAITSVSGRGVGMDVVKRNIEALRGSVEIESVVGQGTRLTIRLPLTLAIIDGLLVRVGAELFVLPLTDIEACQERLMEDTPPVVGTVEHRGEMIPCVSVRRLLDVPGEQPPFERVVITRVDGKMVGLAVDVVVGQQQAVIKPLAEVFKSVRFISGTTVNGDGGISVILDIPTLVGFAQEQARKEASAQAQGAA